MVSAISLKRIGARFYQTAAGNQPVRDWLLALSGPDCKIVGGDIATMEFGWPIGMPVCRSVKGSVLREVRSTIKNGRVEARVLFVIDGSDMVLLHGFEKKPSQQGVEIALGEARWKDMKRRMGRPE